MMNQEEIQALIGAAFPDADIELVDLTGTRDHYQLRVVTPAFEGKTPIEQHRMVYGALGNAMAGAIHALALKTYTPAAWQKVKGGS